MEIQERAVRPKESGKVLLIIDNLKIVFLLFLIVYIIDWTRPFLYVLMYNRWDLLFIATGEFVVHFLPFLFILILIIFSNYAMKEIDELFLLSAKKSKFIQNFFTENELFNQFSNEFYKKSFSKYNLIIPLTISFVIISFSFFSDWSTISLGGVHYYWPFWSVFYYIIQNIALFTTSFGALLIIYCFIRGFFFIKEMLKNRDQLSITIFIKNLQVFLFKKDKEMLIKNKNSTSYFGFQESNRVIGEFLFKISGFLLLLSVLCSGILFGLYFLFDLTPHIQYVLLIGMITFFIMDIITLFIFIYPQLEVHEFLKEYKREIMDLFNLKIEEISSYFLLSFHESIELSLFNPKWKTTEDLIHETEMLMMYVEQMESMGTWSYDFPEIFKLVAVALSPLIILIAAFFTI